MINTAQVSRLMRMNLMLDLRMLMVVVIKLTAPRMEETPARCSEKIAMSTEAPL